MRDLTIIYATLPNIADVSNNRIYELPAGFEKLTNLKTLNLESNRLETIPGELYKLRALKILNLAKNRIYDLPDSICELTELKVLNVEKNKLSFVPASLATMQLVDLKIGHNLIEQLPSDLFLGELGKTVKHLSCCENNLFELPWSLCKVDPECFIDCDFNPLISPPPYLLAEGLQVLQNYLRIKQVRMVLFEDLIKDEDFVIGANSLTPIAFEVLRDGTGFLTPEDLAEFDQAVNEYMNGEYYRCPATGEELVESVTKLRDKREFDLYYLIVQTFIDTVAKLVKADDPRFTSAAITVEQRPWGRRGELVNCWVVSLLSLLRDAPPNKFQPEGRPSLFSLGTFEWLYDALSVLLHWNHMPNCFLFGSTSA